MSRGVCMDYPPCTDYLRMLLTNSCLSAIVPGYAQGVAFEQRFSMEFRGKKKLHVLGKKC